MLGFSEIKGVDEGKERRGEVKEKGSKSFLRVCLHQKKRVILKNKFEKGIFTFKDF